MVDDQWNPELEIRCRIEQARATFLKLKKILTNRDLNFKLRYRMVECYVWSVLLYGAEAWTLKAAAINRIETFEMWTLRRMLKISWTEHARNDDGNMEGGRRGIGRKILSWLRNIRQWTGISDFMKPPGIELYDREKLEDALRRNLHGT
nr:unnamed protein product [Callosobruchus chinensis]